MQEQLLAAVRGADELVLLGDTIELREGPAREALDASRALLAALGAAVGRIVVVPGNHDHQLAAPWLDSRRLNGASVTLDEEPVAAAGQPGILGALAELLAPAEVVLAYPGYRMRGDVWATHGHYLDCHMTVPRVECLAVGVMKRFVRGLPSGHRSAEDYEKTLAPLYSLSYALAQGAGPPREVARETPSVAVWKGLHRGGPRSWLLERVAVPGAVSLFNAAGLGPFDTDLSGVELRRAGLRAMDEVVRGLGVEAAHVIFGHTHRPGPLPDDSPAEWGRLVNCGSWLHQSAFLDGASDDSPYWPGTVVWVDAEGAPRLERVLAPGYSLD